MTHPTPKQSDKLGLKIAFAAVFASIALLLWSISTTDKQNGNDTFFDEQGYQHVLGVSLGHSTLRESETALKSRSDVALYIYPSEHAEPGRRLEAFFPAIADHSKVILLLQADRSTLDAIEQRATLPHLYPDGVARMNLASEDLTRVQQLVVGQLSLIPSIALNEQMLIARFGQPASSTRSNDGKQHYHFPDIGLTATIDHEGLATLRFRSLH